jgi:hypothetical protein
MSTPAATKKPAAPRKPPVAAAPKPATAQPAKAAPKPRAKPAPKAVDVPASPVLDAPAAAQAQKAAPKAAPKPVARLVVKVVTATAKGVAKPAPGKHANGHSQLVRKPVVADVGHVSGSRVRHIAGCYGKPAFQSSAVLAVTDDIKGTITAVLDLANAMREHSKHMSIKHDYIVRAERLRGDRHIQVYSAHSYGPASASVSGISKLNKKQRISRHSHPTELRGKDVAVAPIAKAGRFAARAAQKAGV